MGKSFKPQQVYGLAGPYQLAGTENLVGLALFGHRSAVDRDDPALGRLEQDGCGAAEAERSGLVSRVVPVEDYLEVALDAAAKIASYSRPVVAMAKDVIELALETPLTQGIKSERQLFKSTFALDDQKEGMAAFVEKRSPQFKHR